MNLTSFAPADFKKHLEDLENTIRFNKARIVNGLGLSNMLQHYVLTGNDGAGMDDAVNAIYELVKEAFNISECEVKNAEELFDSTDGFESSLKDVCQSNKMLYITHADALSMKGNVGHKNGMEVLCEKIPYVNNCIVALSGRRNRLTELIKGNDKANEVFANIFHFDDLTPECMMEYVMDYANEHNYVLAPETEEKLKPDGGRIFSPPFVTGKMNIYGEHYVTVRQYNRGNIDCPRCIRHWNCKNFRSGCFYHCGKSVSSEKSG